MNSAEEKVPTWEEYKAGVQKVLDTPGYNKAAMAEATKWGWHYGMSLQMSQDISAYYNTENSTNGKIFEYNWD